MADIKYSEAARLVNTDLNGTELISLSYDTAYPSTPGEEVWEDRAITFDELKNWLTS